MKIKSYHSHLDAAIALPYLAVEHRFRHACGIVNLKRTYYALDVIFVYLLRRLGINLVESVPECINSALALRLGKQSCSVLG